MSDFFKGIHLVTVDHKERLGFLPRISYVTLKLEHHLLRIKHPSGNSRVKEPFILLFTHLNLVFKSLILKEETHLSFSFVRQLYLFIKVVRI